MMKDNGLASAGPSDDGYKVKTKRVVFKNITNVTTSNQKTLPRELVDSSYCSNIKLLRNSVLQQTLSMRIVLLDLGGWAKCGLGINKATEYFTSGYNSDGNIGSNGFLIARLDGKTGKILQTDITFTEGRRSSIGDGLYPEGSEEFDTRSGANSALSNTDYALVSSKCLGYGGDALKQSNKQFVRTIHQDTYDVSALLLLISVADSTAESKLYRRLTRYALLLSTHATCPQVLQQGYSPETLEFIKSIGIDKVSRFLTFRTRTAIGVIYGMWQLDAVTEEFCKALPPLMRDHLLAIRDGEHVTAIREAACPDTNWMRIMVENLADGTPNYASDFESQLSIFKHYIAKWCRVFLGNYARQGEVVEAKREILKAFGCDRDWMKHRMMYGHDIDKGFDV